MNQALKVGFITTVSGRWPRELPNRRNAEYGSWLKENINSVDWITFDYVLDSSDTIESAIRTLREQEADLVVMVYGAFTGDDVSTMIAEAIKVPMILWAPEEPDLGGGRLLSNALVALTMNSASMRRLGHTSYPVYGGLTHSDATKRVRSLVLAYRAAKSLKGSLLGMFGYRPTAFYNSAFDEGLIRRTFGIRIEETDLKVVFDRMAAQDTDAVAEDRALVKSAFSLDPANPEEHVENHSRLYLALKQLMLETGYQYASIKCWPEMGSLHTTPCAVLGRLIDEGLPIACEGDVDAAITMFAETAITGKATFITDLIDINEDENYLTFWHCGNAAPSLHACPDQALMCNHPLAGQGTAFRSVLKEGKVTVARFCNIEGAYKLFMMRGVARQTDMYTPGCMVNVTVETPVKQCIYRIIEEGVPHHYSIVWEDIAEEMITLCKLLNIEVVEC